MPDDDLEVEETQPGDVELDGCVRNEIHFVSIISPIIELEIFIQD